MMLGRSSWHDYLDDSRGIAARVHGVERILNVLHALFFGLYLSPPLALFMAVEYRDESRAELTCVLVLLSLIALIVIGETLHAWFLRARRKILLRKARERPLTWSDSPSLHRLVQNLAREMAVDVTELVLVKNRSLASYPSIGQMNDAVCIFVPVGFMKLVSADIDAARAVLAHELAHLVQGDVRLWGTALAVRTSLRRVIMPCICVLILFNALVLALIPDDGAASFGNLQGQSIVQIVYQLVLLIAIWLICGNVARLRRDSERLADRAAVAMTGADALIRALVFGRPFWRVQDRDGQRSGNGFHLALDERIRQIATGVGTLGDYQLARDDIEGARHSFEEQREIRAKLAEREPTNKLWQRDLALSLDKLGDVQRRQGCLDAAYGSFEHGRSIRATMAACTHHGAQEQHDLSDSLNRLGDVSLQQGKLEEAERHFVQSCALREHYVACLPNHVPWQLEFSVSLDKLGEVHLARGNLTRALEVFERSRAIRAALFAAHPHDSQLQRALAVSAANSERVASAAAL
jgi:Zn-dependent protease with chaperone function/tetratricopeptide (TPR) repeat protein